MEEESVCIVGLGFVGLTLAAKLSQKIKVYGLETNPSVLATISQGKGHFFEPGLDDAVQKSILDNQLVPIATIEELPNGVGSFVITVGTPMTDGSINLQSLERAVTEISKKVSDESLVVIRSTVGIGVTRSNVLGYFETEKGLTPHIAMCPERTVEGKALEELSTLPQVIGADTREARERAIRLFSHLGCPIQIVSNLETAEAVKLVANTYRDVQFAFANEVALFSEAIGVDAREVISASNKGYPRSAIARPGLTGGPCLEKDPWIYVKSAEIAGLDAGIAKAARQTHESIIPQTMSRIVNLYRSYPYQPQGVLIAGLAFKGNPPTSDTRGSLAKVLARSIENEIPSSQLFGFDPLVSFQDAFAMGVDLIRNLEEKISECRLVIIQNDNSQITSDIKKYLIRNPAWKGAVFDFSGTLEILATDNVQYERFGRKV
jgi:nucleotide sugar dehydrogenase